MSKRKPVDEPDIELDPATCVEITPLGAGQEVGRSCIILKYMGKCIMFDCGIHPGHSGISSLPYLDDVDLATVDVALITHFHLDHCAAVPYLVGRTKFKGRILMTHPTKVIYHSLLKDFVKMSKGSVDEALYSEKDLELSMERIEVVDFHQTLDIDGIKVTPYRAGHVLGAAMFMVEIAGMRALYTGDYSRVADRHLPAADIPSTKPHIVIIESTYGVSRHLPRDERERRFLDRVISTISRGGRVLLPVVALGRAQELLLLLEEYWETHPELQNVPIYQTSAMARRALPVFQTYMEMMNDDIKAVFHVRNPFNFKHIHQLKSASQFDDIGACVVMATPSMLQSGLSRDLLEMWCESERNTVIICDFAVQGTMAKDLLGAPSHILTKSGVKVPLRIGVEHISFSAHADFDQTSGFLDALQPPHVVLVHGEATEMMRLRNALERGAAALNIPRSVNTPKVCQPVLIPYKAERVAKVVGRLAEKPAHEGQQLRGVLIHQGFTDQIIHPADLPKFTKLYTGKISNRQAIAVDKPFQEIRLALEVMFEGMQGDGHYPVSTIPPSKTGDQAVSVGGVVSVVYKAANPKAGYDSHLIVEWEGGSIGDMVADAVVAVILQAIGEPPAMSSLEATRLAALQAGDASAAEEAEMQLVATLMKAQFGPTQLDYEQGLVTVMVDQQPVVIHYKSGKVVCSDIGLRTRINKALTRIIEAMRPCPLDFDL